MIYILFMLKGLRKVRYISLDIQESYKNSGAPNGNFQENICSEDDLRSRIFGAFVVKFLAFTVKKAT